MKRVATFVCALALVCCFAGEAQAQRRGLRLGGLGRLGGRLGGLNGLGGFGGLGGVDCFLIAKLLQRLGKLKNHTRAVGLPATSGVG